MTRSRRPSGTAVLAGVLASGLVRGRAGRHPAPRRRARRRYQRARRHHRGRPGAGTAYHQSPAVRVRLGIRFQPQAAPHDIGAFQPGHQRGQPEPGAGVTATAPTLIRYPGGTLSNDFDWHRAIGPRPAAAASTASISSPRPPAPTARTKHMAFLSQIGGAQADFVVNNKQPEPAGTPPTGSST